MTEVVALKRRRAPATLLDNQFAQFLRQEQPTEVLSEDSPLECVAVISFEGESSHRC